MTSTQPKERPIIGSSAAASSNANKSENVAEDKSNPDSDRGGRSIFGPDLKIRSDKPEKSILDRLRKADTSQEKKHSSESDQENHLSHKGEGSVACRIL